MARSASPAKTARLPSLDGLRALSIAAVLAGHAAPSMGIALRLSKCGDLGALGVRVFFTISGFLITSLLLEEFDSSGRISIPGFYLRRTFRIFPAFYVYAGAIGLCAAGQWISLRPGDLLAALTYTTNYHYDRSWWLGHAWSLAVEEQFYLLFPLVFACFGRRAAAIASAAMIAISPMVRVFLISNAGLCDAAGEAFPAVADTIAMGCLLAMANPWLGRQPRYLAALRSRAFALIPAAVLLLNSVHGGRIRGGLIDSLIAILIALIIDRCVRFPDGVSGRVLNSWPFVQAGVLSYSIYLWQQPFLTRFVSYPCQRFPFNVVCLALAAWLSYRFVERPFLTLRRRIEQFRRSRRAIAPAASSRGMAL